MTTSTPNLGLVLADDIAPNDDVVDVTVQIANNFSALDTILGNADSVPDTLHARLLELEAQQPRYVYKTADEIVNNASTLQNDDDLVLPLPANSVHEVLVVIRNSSSTVADFKYDFTAPAGATFSPGISRLSSVAVDGRDDSLDVIDLLSASSFTGGIGASSVTPIIISGLVTTVGTAGNLQFRFAQQTLEVSNTTCRNGSFMRLIKVSPIP